MRETVASDDWRLGSDSEGEWGVAGNPGAGEAK